MLKSPADIALSHLSLDAFMGMVDAPLYVALKVPIDPMVTGPAHP
jgi:hypothetical protein